MMAEIVKMKTGQSAFERRKTARGATYFETGEGDPLVLIHGVGPRLEAWAPQISVLGGGCRVLAVDMPGAEMARDMADLAPAGYTRIIQGHRHMVNLTAPDAVNRPLLEWLALPEAGA